jgi:hypothetical protein
MMNGPTLPEQQFAAQFGAQQVGMMGPAAATFGGYSGPAMAPQQFGTFGGGFNAPAFEQFGQPQYQPQPQYQQPQYQSQPQYVDQQFNNSTVVDPGYGQQYPVQDQGFSGYNQAPQYTSAPQYQ